MIHSQGLQKYIETADQSADIRGMAHQDDKENLTICCLNVWSVSKAKEEQELLKECCLCLLHVVDRRVLTFYNGESMQE